ncbi:hypothetical protein E8E13_001854 [Curvularia kusanoi]|uniref:Uncharacterized protein n=1 Tax=Curvularia kusanoi TaxID=90978 RepID=A0A9P4TBT4_CURKU|nr:hypothetical protein E8E13_001854 [Curvularia kusanoi]
MSGVMDKVKAKVDNVLHKDKDTTHTGTTGTHHSDPTGPHNTHAANQADPRVDSDRYGAAGNTAGAGGVGAGQYGTTGTHGTHGTTGSGLTGSHTTHGSDPTGPHDSRLANKADPRVDSDRVGTAGNTGSAGGLPHETHTSGQQTYRTDGNKLPDALLEDQSRAEPHSGAGLSHSSHGHNTGSGLTGSNTHHSDPTGPHDSKLANKLDPRVDSDKYGAAGNTAGAGGVGAGQYGSTGTHGTHTGTHTGSGLTGSHGTHTGSDPTGPHNSHLANKADPRVDSDRYGAAGNTAGAGGVGAGQYGSTGTHTTGSGLTGNTGTGYGSTGTGYSDPTGPHDSRLGNKADPRVDSDHYGGQGNTYGTNQSSGLTGTNAPGHVGNSNANKTAGPHGSNLLNKLDPRVDSDLDGSKTTGGDRTYA